MISERDLRFIDTYNRDGTGWARFSADGLQRYRLGRIINTRALPPLGEWHRWQDEAWRAAWVRVVFLMLNPSDADAFKPDNTVSRCVKFAQIWGADVLEVVNLFAFRSPYPKDLRRASYRGDGPENDAQILAACKGAHRVVAAWGAGGDFDLVSERARHVEEMLRFQGIALHCLARTDDGTCPKHPLARGRHFIPYTKELEVY